MVSSNVGLTEPDLLELVGLSFNHGCRTFSEQNSLLRACAKLDRRHGTADGQGLVLHAVETYKPCAGPCGNHAAEDRVRDLNEEFLAGRYV